MSDNTVWQSSNEGFTWSQVGKGEEFLSINIHPYFRDHGYLVGKGRKVWWTADAGENWKTFNAPVDPNALGLALLTFHPTRADWLIWTGSEDCTSTAAADCRAIAYYSTDSGSSWHEIDSYVRTCSWGRDKGFKIDERTIFCESYQNKKGSQKATAGNPLQLVSGSNFYKKKDTLFSSGVVGYATFEEFFVVAHVRLCAEVDHVRLTSP